MSVSCLKYMRSKKHKVGHEWTPFCVIKDLWRFEDEIILYLFVCLFIYLLRILKESSSQKASLYIFSPETLARLFVYLKEVKPSPGHKMP